MESGMHQYLNLPDWLPWWVPLVLLLPTLLWALSFLFMPFSVFGVKSRLDLIEARLDEIQNEIRHVALRLPPPGMPAADYDDSFPPRMPEQRPPERDHDPSAHSAARRMSYTPPRTRRPPPMVRGNRGWRTGRRRNRMLARCGEPTRRNGRYVPNRGSTGDDRRRAWHPLN